jgi:outer membrane protein assembly factor BamE (lipoprotein component of BamABCDE complex)
VKKRGLVILGVVVLLGAWLMVIGYEFLEKENALLQKRVKAAKEEQQRCTARNSKYRNYDQFRTSIRLPYTSDLPVGRWMHQYDTLRAGMSESEVEIILGAPDYARCDVNKDGDKFVGSTWMYAVAVPQDMANDSQNSGIQIVFGPDGKVTDKNVMNMEAKPSPAPSAAATPAPSVPAPTSTPPQDATPSPTATPQPTPNVNATPAIEPSATPVTAPPQVIPSATATPTPTPL